MELNLFTIVLLSAALIGAFVGVLMLVFVSDRSRHEGRWLLPSFILLVLVPVAFKTIAIQRDLSRYSEDVNTILGGYSASAEWLLRLASLSMVGVSLAVILAGLFKSKRSSGVDWSLLLVCSFSVYLFTNTLLNGLLGTVPELDRKQFYCLVVFVAVYFSSFKNPHDLADMFKFGALGFIVIGLVFLVLQPSLVLQTNYRSLIPFFDIRFWGVDAHANGLGPLAAVTFLVFLWRPLGNRRLQLGVLLTCFCVLVATQSKTAILAFVAACLVMRMSTTMFSPEPVMSAAARHRSLVRLASFFLVSAGAIAALIFLPFGSLLGFLDDKALSSASQLTGRDVIWSASLQEFWKSPLFGYGNALWGPEFANQNGLLGVASNAHNQFVDVLSSAGLFGLAGFLFYFGVLSAAAWNLRVVTRGFSLALLCFLLVRGIPEVPFRTHNVMSNDFLIHFLLFGVLSWSRSSSSFQRDA